MANWEKDIEKIVQDKLKGFSPTPPPAVKSAINKSVFSAGKLWLVLFSAMIVIGAGLFITYYNLKENKENTELAQNKSEYIKSLENGSKKTNQLNNSSNVNGKEFLNSENHSNQNENWNEVDNNNSNANGLVSNGLNSIAANNANENGATRSWNGNQKNSQNDLSFNKNENQNNKNHNSNANDNFSEVNLSRQNQSNNSNVKNSNTKNSNRKSDSDGIENRKNLNNSKLPNNNDLVNASTSNKKSSNQNDKNQLLNNEENSNDNDLAKVNSLKNRKSGTNQLNKSNNNENVEDFDLAESNSSQKKDGSSSSKTAWEKMAPLKLEKRISDTPKLIETSDLSNTNIPKQNRFKLKPMWELNANFGLGTNKVRANQIPASSGSSATGTSLFSMRSSPNYNFDLNARVYFKDWNVSTGLGYDFCQYKEEMTNKLTEQTQIGTNMVVDTTWVQLNDTTQIPQYDTTFVPVYQTTETETSGKVLHTVQNLSLPIQFGYRFRFNKFHLHLNGGVRFNFPIVTTSKIQSGDLFENTYANINSSPYKKANMTLMLSTEFHYVINAKWSVSVRPRYQYQLTPVFKTIYNRNKHRGSISFGVHYYF